MCPNRHTKTRLLCVCVWGEREKTKQKTTIVTSIPAIINVLNAIVEKMNSSHFYFLSPTHRGRKKNYQPMGSASASCMAWR